MKRFLLFTLFFSFMLGGYSQGHNKDIVTLNELYTDPGSGMNEFIELYNSSLKPVNMDDYTILLYYNNGTTSGFYVLDLPASSVPRDAFYVLASASTYYAQANTPLTASFDWSAVVDATAGNAYLRKYQLNGTSYLWQPMTPTEVNNLMYPRSGGGGQFHVFVYDESDLVNVFISSANSMPSYITSLPPLTIPFFKNGVLTF